MTTFLRKQNAPEKLLPFKHLTRRKERSFKCDVLQRSGRTYLYKPERQFLVQLVKFAPGKGLQDYVKFYDEIDRRLRKKYRMTRHQMDMHEIVTFVTYGEYDMVVLWDAKDLDTVNKVLAEAINPAINPNGFGSSQTQIVAMCAHP